MNSSSSDLDYPEYEPEDGLDPEVDGQAEDPHSPLDGLSDAPDLSDDPFESEAGGLVGGSFDLEDLFETIPYWSAGSRSVDVRAEFERPDLETLEFEEPGFESAESRRHSSKRMAWNEDYMAPEGPSKRGRKKPPTGTRPKFASSASRLEELRRAIYTSGARAGRSNALEQTAGPRQDVANRYASADLLEARQLLHRMAQAAQSAATVDEAAGLAGALPPVALRLCPQVARGLWPALPALVACNVWLARNLYGRAQYGASMAWLPKILESTLDSLAKGVRAGRPVTSHLAAAMFARRAASLLAGPDRPPQRDQRRPSGKQDQKPSRGRNGQD